MAKKENMTLEQRFEVIEEILEQMEDGTLSLDDSFRLYKEGLAEIQAANAQLGEIEQAIMVLNEDGSLEAME